MRFIYVDPGLINDVGHNPSYCRTVVKELRRRAIPTAVYGFASLDSRLAAELDAKPLFRGYLYYLTDGDPQTGWAKAFSQVVQATAEDLATIPNIGSDDIVYVASAYAGQLMGGIEWLSGFPREKAPLMVIDLLGHPGVQLRPTATGYSMEPWPLDPRAMLYRRAASHLAEGPLPSLVVSYADRASAHIYSRLLGIDVLTLPIPLEAVHAESRSRAGRRPITISLLGNQRSADKGYHLVPALADGLLQSHRDIRIRIHNSLPGCFPAADDAVRELAKQESRVMLDERALSTALWAELLDEASIILCPYSPVAYQFMSSGVHSEAIANAIPSVVPAETALSRALAEFGGSGTSFERFDAASVLAATRRLLDRYDDYAEKAVAAAKRWREMHGAARLVDAVLRLAEERPAGRRRQ